MAISVLNLLSARKVETAQPKPKVYQLRDGGSLFLRVQPNGSKLWWYRYRLGGVEQVYSIGMYPKITLEAARAEFDGVDERQVAKALQLGAERAQAGGFQYIVTMNSDALPHEGFRADFDVYSHIISPKLTDVTDTGGLFGLRFE